MENRKKQGFWESVAKNILISRGYKMTESAVIDQRTVPGDKGLGASQARVAILGQQLQNLSKEKHEQPKNDGQKWDDMKKEMTRLPYSEGKHIEGHEKVDLGRLHELYIDKMGNIWFNTKLGQDFEVFGGAPWRETFNTPHKSTEKVLYINYHRNDAGDIKFFDQGEYQPIIEPQSVFMSPDNEKVNMPELLDSYSNLEAENERIADYIIETNAEVTSMEKRMEANLQRLSDAMEDINTKINILSSPLKKKQPDKGGKKDAAEDK